MNSQFSDEVLFVYYNKKVLLRERKRRTAHRVASPLGGGGYPPWLGEGGLPTLARGYLPTLARGGGTTYLGWGVPTLAQRSTGSPPPGCGRIHTCENITFPHSVGNAGGNYSRCL